MIASEKLKALVASLETSGQLASELAEVLPDAGEQLAGFSVELFNSATELREVASLLNTPEVGRG